MHIYNLRWLAKLNFKVLYEYFSQPSQTWTLKEEVDYEFRELRQFGKFLSQVHHLQ